MIFNKKISTESILGFSKVLNEIQEIGPDVQERNGHINETE